MISENEIENILKSIVDPLSGKDLVALNAVKDIKIKPSKVTVDLYLGLATRTSEKEIQKRAEEALLKFDGVSVVKININVKQYQNDPRSSVASESLNKVKTIVAISSCKGGVGKSTVAAHLALELVSRNLKVGLLDADIYGPSVPTLFNLPKVNIYTNEQKKLIPLDHNKMKLMSFGFLLGNAPAVMRGPIVSQYTQQLLHATDWGELDYLLIDMPPGTGDIHLTITQTVRLDGAVIVTTPHTLSLTDVARGIMMFEKVSVPIIGVIENMAYFKPDDSDTKHYIFGNTSATVLEENFGITSIGEIPVLPALGQTLVEHIGNAYVQEAADKMVKAVEKIKTEDRSIPSIQFDKDNIYLVWKSGETWTVNNRALRLISKDALSVNELTGESLIKPEDIRKDIAAKDITPLGNYAIGITWNDGHSSAIYPYKSIREISTVS